MKTTPPIDGLVKLADEKATGVGVEQPKSHDACMMISGRCTTHDCAIKKVTTRKKVWCWIDRKKSFGFKHTQKTRLLCINRFGTDSATCKNESIGELVGGDRAGVVMISSATLEIRKKSESSDSSNHLKAS